MTDDAVVLLAGYSTGVLVLVVLEWVLHERRMRKLRRRGRA